MQQRWQYFDGIKFRGYVLKKGEKILMYYILYHRLQRRWDVSREMSITVAENCNCMVVLQRRKLVGTWRCMEEHSICQTQQNLIEHSVSCSWPSFMLERFEEVKLSNLPWDFLFSDQPQKYIRNKAKTQWSISKTFLQFITMLVGSQWVYHLILAWAGL